jgi:hypothetical protein
MTNETTRAIIDFAYDENGAEMRNALYSAIQDKVLAHIDAKKQEIAHNLIAQPEEAEIADENV